MSAPLPDKPRWVNPCSLPGHAFDASRDTVNLPPDVTERDIYLNVIDRATVARNHAIHAKDIFVRSIFNDPEFEEGLSDTRHTWLPDLPDLDKSPYYTLPRDLAFLRAYMVLQSYGVGLEQAIIDQTLYEGRFISLFRSVEDHLTQVLCELQLGMHMLNIRPEPDIERAIMSHEYRKMENASNRNWRDYLLLRDLIKANNFVIHVFERLANSRPHHL